MNHAIECRGLTKTYPGDPPTEAVRGIDLMVPEGLCFGVLGPNGAGKTTTIEILEGVLPATSGEALIFGRSWATDRAVISEEIGLSLQETVFSERLTVFETVSLFRSFYKTGLDPMEVITRVALEDKKDARLGRLSGGQRQRVSVAVALVSSPRLLFLDEPTTGLDPQSRRVLWELVSEFRENGGTVLLTTHYMDEAERLCDVVAIFDHGRILDQDSPRNLISRLGSDQVIEFAVKSENGQTVDDSFGSDLPGVSSVRLESGLHCLSVEKPHITIPALLSSIPDGCELSTLSIRRATLEDVFVEFTGRHLDDEEQP